jgi:hypothetical protein
MGVSFGTQMRDTKCTELGFEKFKGRYQLISLCRCKDNINPSKAELIPIRYLLALVGAHHILHVSRVRVKLDLNDIRLLGVDWIHLP